MIVVVNLFDLVPDQEALYAEYLARVQPILIRHGAKVLFYGRARAVFRGELRQEYCGMIGYESATALRGFSQDPDFVAIRALRDDSTRNWALSVFEEACAGHELSLPRDVF